MTAYPYETHEYDVVVVGAGGAGLRATLGSMRRDVWRVVAGAAVALLLALATFSLFSADPHCVGSVNCSLEAAANDATDGTTVSDSTVTDGAAPVTTLAGQQITTTTVAKVPQPFVAIGESDRFTHRYRKPG